MNVPKIDEFYQLFPPLFLPPVSWFHLWVHAPSPRVLADCPMVKRSLQTRAFINGPNGLEVLSPNTSRKSRRRNYRDVDLTYMHKWPQDIARSIENAFKKAPFFEHYWPEYKYVLSEKRDKLYRLNTELLNQLFKDLRIAPPRFLTLDEQPQSAYVAAQHCKTDWKIPENTTLVDGLLTKNAQPPGYAPVPYYAQFEPVTLNPSMLELLFAQGPRAKLSMMERKPLDNTLDGKSSVY